MQDRVIDLSKFVVLNRIEIFRNREIKVEKIWIVGHHGYIPGSFMVHGLQGAETEFKYTTQLKEKP